MLAQIQMSIENKLHYYVCGFYALMLDEINCDTKQGQQAQEELSSHQGLQPSFPGLYPHAVSPSQKFRFELEPLCDNTHGLNQSGLKENVKGSRICTPKI